NLRHLIVTAKTTAQQADIGLQGVGAEIGFGAFKHHRAGAAAAGVFHALRAFQNGDAVVFFREHIGRGRVHAVAATAEDGFTIQQNAQARGRHTTEQRVAVGATFADYGKARDAFQQVGTIVGRYRLARGFRVGDHG